MLYEVRQGESIYDVAVKLYGSVSYCVKLCEDNGIDLNTDISHLFLEYDPSIKTRVNVQFTLNSITQVPDRSYFIKEGQSIYDLALMFGYGIENVAFRKFGRNEHRWSNNFSYKNKDKIKSICNFE